MSKIVKLYEARMAENVLKDNNRKSKLAQIENADLRQQIALALQNQLSCNTIKMPNFFKQLCIPTLLYSLYGLPHELIGLQTLKMSAASDDIFYLKKPGELNSMVTMSVIPQVTPCINVRALEQDIPPDELMLHGADVAINIVEDVVYKAVLEMMDYAESQAHSELSSQENLLQIILNAGELLKETIGRSANFVVLPILFAKMLKQHLTYEYDFDSLPTNIRRIGYLQNRMMIFINGHERNRILVGYRGIHPVDVGYIYAHQVMFYNFLKAADRYNVEKTCAARLVRPDYFCTIDVTIPRTMSAILEF